MVLEINCHELIIQHLKFGKKIKTCVIDIALVIAYFCLGKILAFSPKAGILKEHSECGNVPRHLLRQFLSVRANCQITKAEVNSR
jgi:hypothetical protein